MTDASAEDRPIPADADAPAAPLASAAPLAPAAAPDRAPPAAADVPPRRGAWWKALYAVGFALFTLSLLQPVSDPLLGFHLRIGEMIRGKWSEQRMGPIPTGVGARPHPTPPNPLQPNLADPFSVRRFGAATVGATGRLDAKLHWHPPSWAYDRLLAEVFVWTGWTGVVGLRVVVGLLAAFALERLLARRGASPAASAGLFFLVLLASPEPWRDGPSAWGLWFSLLALEAGWRWSEGKPRMADLTLPLVFALWAQMEPTVWIGLVTLGWGAVLGAGTLRQGDTTGSLQLRTGLTTAVLLLAVGACLLAPAGGDVWKATLDSIFRWQLGGRFPGLASDKLDALHAASLALLGIAAGGLAWLAKGPGRARRLSLLLLAAAGTALTGDGVGWAAAAFGTVLADVWSTAASAVQNGGAKGGSTLAAWPLTRGAAFATAALGLLAGGTRLPWNVAPLDQFAIPSDDYPRLAAEFIRESARVFSAPPEARPARIDAWIAELRARGVDEGKLQRFRDNLAELEKWPPETRAEALFSCRTGPVSMPWQWADLVLGAFPSSTLDTLVDRRVELHGVDRLAKNEAVWDEASIAEKEMPEAISGLAQANGDDVWESAVIMADVRRPLAAALRADKKRFFPIYEDGQAALFFRIPMQFRPPGAKE